MRTASSKAGIAVKVIFGAAILTWMATSGKLNLSQVGRTLAQWPVTLAIVALLYAQVGVAGLRWKLLLKAQDVKLSFRRVWGLSMIGMLFNIVIPGAVGGDLVKGYYITRATGGRKSHAATSILMDRVTGLIGLLFLGAAMALVNLDETLRSSATRSLGLTTMGAFLAGMVGLYVAVFAGGALSRWELLPGVLRNVFDALHEYRTQKSVIPVALALSVFNQALSCAMYYLALWATGVTDMPLSQFFLIVPLGLVATAIPISPGGIGVGQAAFFALFQIVAPKYGSLGSDALTVYQVLLVLVCCSGLYWYVSYKHEKPEAATREVEIPHSF